MRSNNNMEYMEKFYYMAVIASIISLGCSIVVDMLLKTTIRIVLVINILFVFFLIGQFLFRKKTKVENQIFLTSLIITSYGGYLFYRTGYVGNGLFIMLSGMALAAIFLDRSRSIITLVVAVLMIIIHVFGVVFVGNDIFHLIGMVIVYIVIATGTSLVKSNLSNYAISLKKMNDDLHLEKEKIEKLAYFDSLTKLPNRNHFASLIYERVSKGENGMLILLDIVDFHKINEVNGYNFGDKMLKELSKFLSDNLLESSIIGYLGNNTFAIWMDHKLDCLTINEYVTTNTEQFNKEINKILPISFYSCSIPVGVLTNNTSEALISLGEKAMLKQKKEKLMNLFIDDTMYQEISKYDSLVEYVISSIENNAYTVVYQEKFDTMKNVPYGVEVLSRLKKDSKDISPNQFIKILEDKEMIIKFGSYIYEKVFIDFQKLITIYGEDVLVSFNVSPKELMYPEFTNDLINLMKKHNISAKNIELEVTENVLISNLDLLEPIIHDLKRKGIKISLDDFGSGYPSLSYLANLPVDIIKIDKSFMVNLEGNDIQRSVLTAVINIAFAKQLSIVAEGVETIEQSNILKEIGCTKIQGYYYSRPKSLEEIKYK